MIVPHRITEVYTLSPKNKTLIIIIKAVFAIGKVTLLILIISTKVHVES